MNLKAPLNPDKLAETWPKVEESIEEAEAIAAYLAGIDKQKTQRPSIRPDYRKQRRRWE